MNVARVVIEAPVVSFRYPHFLIGRQPTFQMPPPSTIFGHIASALGEEPPRTELRVGCHFTFRAAARDYEHQQILAPGRPEKVKGDAARLLTGWMKMNPLNLGGTIQPTVRDFLFDCRLTLYIDPPRYGEAFQSPVFCVNLGRSQDLASIRRIDLVDLERAERGYLEHTLLPFEWARPRTPRGVTVMMSRYIGPPPERDVDWSRYVLLHERVFLGRWDDTDSPSLGQRLLDIESDRPDVWIDPDSERVKGAQRAVEFLSFA
jgi:CRISPR-associated protein Cas5t